jgi:hypothetical protein
MRLAALAGAAYHSHGGPYPNAPYFLRPPSLDHVVKLLADEEARIRLHGAAWLLDGATHPARKERLHGAAQKVLGSAMGVAPLAKQLDDESDHPPAVRGWNGSAGHLRSRCARALTVLSEMAPTGCIRRGFHLATDFRVMADPQNWSTEAPVFWTVSKRVTDTGGQFVPVPNPPPPGSIPYAGLLEEVISLSVSPFFPIVGTNILATTYTNGVDPFGFDVQLYKCESTTIGGSTRAGGIDVDSGGLQVSTVPGDPGWTRLTANKHVRFTARDVCGMEVGAWLNLFAPFVIGAFIGVLVYEGACFGAH